MLTDAPAAQAARLERATSAVGRVLLTLIALARPLVWSGEPTDLANLFVLALLAALAACGALHRACAPEPTRWSWPTALGVAFLAIAAVGSWRSPYPADAWAMWSAWALHLGAVALAAPLVVRHRRWVFAGLLAGLACECLLVAAERLWERPAVLRRIADDPLAIDQGIRGAFLERAGNWRLTGSFLLANTLAAYLIALLPTVVAYARRARRFDSAWLWLLAAAAATALVLSGSKAGILALAIAAAATAVAYARRRVALAALAAAALLLATGLALPPVRARLAASAGVRVDYWRGALALVRERPLTGHGLDGFRAGYPRVKPPGAEYTVIAHEEVLQAAVDLGVVAAALLVAWWIAALARLRPTVATPEDDGDAGPGARATLVAVAALAVYGVVAVGALGDRADAWPGGGWLLAPVGIVALAIVARARRLPPPPAWASWCGVLACLLHALADFHLHSAQVVGVLALLANAASGRARPGAPAPRVRLAWAAAALAVLLPATLGIGWTAWRGQARERVRIAAGALARLDVAEPDERATLALAEALAEYALPPTAAPEELARIAAADGLREALRWPADPAAAAAVVALAAHATQLAPGDAVAWEPTLATLVARWPEHLVFARGWAMYARLRARDDPAWRPRALAAWRAVVALAPTHLPHRAALAEVADAAGEADEARRQRAAIAALAPLVHPDDALGAGR